MEKLQLDYLSPQTVQKYDFHQIPKLLLSHEAFDSVDYGAKLLYGLMLSRASLSATNADGFTDELGRLYIIYTVEQVMADMRCSTKTAVKMINQLAEVGLIEKKRRGQGKSSILYVKDFGTLDFLNCKKYNSRIVKSTIQELYNVQSSYNDFSYNDFSINQSIETDGWIDEIDEYETYTELIKKKIDYDTLKADKSQHDGRLLDEMVALIIEVLCTKKGPVKINGEQKPIQTVKSQLLKLSSDHINYVMKSLSENTTKIKNMKNYILTALYNAPNTMFNHIQQDVNHDLYGAR
jgi:hypothetical protein